MVRPRQFKDEDLLQVARASFIEHGPGVSTSVIAAAAGVSQATLFKRFGTKQDLMVAALAPRPHTPFVALLTVGLTDEPLPLQLERIALEMVRMFDQLLPCVMTLWAAGLTPTDVMPAGETAPPVVARQLLTRLFADAQAQGRMRGGDPENLALHFIGAAKELAFQRHMFPSSAPAQPTEAYARDLVAALWSGCKPQETP